MPGEFIQRLKRPQSITLLNLEPELSFCPVSCQSRRKVLKTPLQTFKLFILHLVAYQKQMVRLHYKTQHILCIHNTEIKLEQNQKLLTCRLDSQCPKMLCRLQGEKSYQPFYLALDPVSYTISQPRKKQAHWCNEVGTRSKSCGQRSPRPQLGITTAIQINGHDFLIRLPSTYLCLCSQNGVAFICSTRSFFLQQAAECKRISDC